MKLFPVNTGINRLSLEAITGEKAVPREYGD